MQELTTAQRRAVLTDKITEYQRQQYGLEVEGRIAVRLGAKDLQQEVVTQLARFEVILRVLAEELAALPTDEVQS